MKSDVKSPHNRQAPQLFKPFEHFVSLNLKTFDLHDPVISEHTWVFVADWPQKGDINQILNYLRTAFLVSCQDLPSTCSSLAISQSNFHSLAKYFTNLKEGDGSSCTLRRGYRHLLDIETLPRNLKFEEERNMFAQQFNQNSPGIGLEAFLAKRKKPFARINQKFEALATLSNWLQVKDSHH